MLAGSLTPNQALQLVENPTYVCLCKWCCHPLEGASGCHPQTLPGMGETLVGE